MILKRKVFYYQETGTKGVRYRQSALIDVDLPEASGDSMNLVYQIGNTMIYFFEGSYWVETKGLTLNKLTEGFKDELPVSPATSLDKAIQKARQDAKTYLIADYEKVYRAVEKPSYASIVAMVRASTRSVLVFRRVRLFR